MIYAHSPPRDAYIRRADAHLTCADSPRLYFSRYSRFTKDSPQGVAVRDFFGDRVLPVPNPILVVLLLPIRLLIPLLLLLLLLLVHRRSDDEGGRRSEDRGDGRRGEDSARVANGGRVDGADRRDEAG